MKVICSVVAIMDYDAYDETEISLRVGDKIEVLHKHPNDWWVGRKQV